MNKDEIKSSISAIKHNTIGAALIITYLIISVYKIGTKELFLAHQVAILPIINIEVPLTIFFIAMPFLVFLLHIKTYLHHYYFAKNFYEVRQSNIGLTENVITASAFSIENGIEVKVVRLLYWLMFYAVFPVILLYIYIKFIPYQSNSISNYHRILIWLSVLLSFYAFYSIQKMRKPQFWLKISEMLKIVFLGLFGVYVLVISTHLVRIPEIESDVDPEVFPFGEIKNRLVITQGSIPESQKLFKEKDLSKFTESLQTKLTKYFENREKVIENSLSEIKVNIKNDLSEKELNRRIKKLINDDDLDTSEWMSFEFQDLFDWIYNYRDELKEYNISNRNFRFIRIIGQDLSLTRFIDCHFHKALFLDVVMHNTKMYRNNFQSTSFINTDLSYSDLRSSLFTDVTFQFSSFKGSNLNFIEMIRPVFLWVNLSNTQFYGSYFKSSIFNAVNWNIARGFAEFTKSIFISGDYYKTSFSKSLFTDSILLDEIEEIKNPVYPRENEDIDLDSFNKYASGLGIGLRKNSEILSIIVQYSERIKNIKIQDTMTYGAFRNISRQTDLDVAELINLVPRLKDKIPLTNTQTLYLNNNYLKDIYSKLDNNAYHNLDDDSKKQVVLSLVKEVCSSGYPQIIIVDVLKNAANQENRRNLSKQNTNPIIQKVLSRIDLEDPCTLRDK